MQERDDMKKGFTLVEMLIVIAIIGILAAVLLSQFGGATEQARAIKCETNLRNLAVAAATPQKRGDYEFYVMAGSSQYARGGEDLKQHVWEHKGWISWLSRNTHFGGEDPSAISSASFVTENIDDAEWALANGVVWPYVGRNRDVYVCPTAKKVLAEQGFKRVHWTYAMNCDFGADSSGGKAEVTSGLLSGIHLDQLERADRKLMFAEIPVVSFDSIHVEKPSKSRNSFACDGVLQHDGFAGEREMIGFNHTFGREHVAMVAFADGHVERFSAPRRATRAEVEKLTSALCRGKVVNFANQRYDINENSVGE